MKLPFLQPKEGVGERSPFGGIDRFVGVAVASTLSIDGLYHMLAAQERAGVVLTIAAAIIAHQVCLDVDDVV